VQTVIEATGDDPRAVLRALRAALNGSGPAVALGGPIVGDVPAGTVAVVTTSGSTGHPKSVILPRAALTSSAMATAARVGDGAWLLALPATYVAGLQVLVRSLVHGREPALLSGRFTPQTFTAATRAMASADGAGEVPRYTSLVPAQVQLLLDADDADAIDALRSYRAILVGGQRLPQPVRDHAAELDVRLVRTYGSSETAGGCVYDGVPLDGVDVIVDAGELCIAGPTLATGYLGDPERTDDVFFVDGDGTRWYRTGDTGDVVDGVVSVTGRLDNVIVSGGTNISLDRVEDAVRTVRALQDAVVVGVDDRRWGEASVIVTTAGGDGLLAIARAVVEAEVGPYARPSRLLTVEAIPTLPSGKPDRRACRELVVR